MNTHPGYIRAVESKITCPPEIYAYPAAARREAAKSWRLPKVPAVSRAPGPSRRWLPAAYTIALIVVWVVAANVGA